MKKGWKQKRNVEMMAGRSTLIQAISSGMTAKAMHKTQLPRKEHKQEAGRGPSEGKADKIDAEVERR